MLKLGELVGFLRVDDSGMDEGMDRGESKFRAFGDRLGLAAAAAGAAVAVALGAALAEGLDVSAANDKLAAQLGASPAEAERLGKVAGDLYSNAYGESIGQVNDAIKSVTKNVSGMATASEAELQGVTASVIDLATAFDVDVAAASRSVGKLMKTGLAKDSTEALDILTRGFQMGNDEAGDLLDTVDEYATQFRNMGISGAQAMGLISQGLKGGARDADVVADTIKEFSIEAVAGGERVRGGFESLGLNADKMVAAFAKGGPAANTALDQIFDKLRAIKDPAERNAVAIELFGTKAEDMGEALFSIDPSAATAALGQVAGASKDLGETLNDNAKTNLESFKRKAQQALVEEVSKAIPHIESLAKWLGENEAIVRPLLYGLTALAAVIGTIVVITKVYTAVQAALNVVMMMNPIGLIVLAVIALIAGIVLLWKNSETFREIVTGAFNAVWGAIKFVWDWVSENWPLLLMILTGPIGIAVGLIIKHWDTIKSAGAAAWNWIIEKIKAFISFYLSMPGRITAGAKGMFTGLVNAARGAINTIIRAWNAIDFSINVRVPDWVPGIGGKGFHVSDVVPDIPYLAKGGLALREGIAMVGEEGPELLHLNRGAAVQPLPSGFGRGTWDGTGGPLRLYGEILVRGDGVLSGLREVVRIDGGDVQATVGTGSYVGV